ncbi:MAG: heavy metal translocating P-type ATPase [bacterium]
MKKQLKIEGMHCTSCSQLIETKLSKTQGVQRANVNYATETATVEYVEDQVSVKELLKVVESAGYKALDKESSENAKKASWFGGDTFKLIFSAILSIPILIISMPQILMIFGINAEMLTDFPERKLLLFLLTTPVQFYAGWEFVRGAYVAVKNKTANMDILVIMGTMSAYLFSVYNTFFANGDVFYETAALLITFILFGKYLEARAKARSGSAIQELMSLQAPTARIIKGGKEIIVPIEEVKRGDTILVKPGEKIPVDGLVTEGNSSIDESMISGESIPIEKSIGSKVIGSTINLHGALTINVTTELEGTVLSKIIKLVEEAQGSKAPIQRLADIVSSYFVVFVIGIALLTFLFWLTIGGMGFEFALMMAVSVLVISCPCALGLATPAAIMVGTGIGAKNGILIKSGEALEKAEQLKAVVFDKTGTLTNGKPVVTDILLIDKKTPETELISIAAAIEKMSEHPLADAIIAKAILEKIELPRATSFASVPGFGASAFIGKVQYFIGNEKYFLKITGSKIGLKAMENLEKSGKTVVIVFKKSAPIGLIAVADQPKNNAAEAIENIQNLGIATYMVTGDNQRTADAIASVLGVEYVIAGVLPDEKGEHVVSIKNNEGPVAFVGDGVNDSIALARADVGIAMGSGTDVAIESGDIVLVKSSVTDVYKAIKLSRLTMSKIRINLFWAFIYNIIGIPIAAGVLYSAYGIILRPEIAGAAMALSSVSVITNSLLLRIRKL